jgi:hypothetical protein
MSLERFIVRDTDSLFCQREADAVAAWIESGKPFHIIRDNRVHNIPILGGTWGAIPGCVPDYALRVSAFFSQVRPDHRNPRGEFHGADQIFLCKFVWPIIYSNHLAHIRAEMPILRFAPNDVELPPLGADGHYVGAVW